MYGKNKIPDSLWLFVAIALVLSFIWSPNFLLSIPIFMYLPFLYRLFFVKGDANVLFWGLLLQWFSVSAQLIYCNVMGMHINELFLNTIFPAALMEYTDYLSIAGVYFFTLGVYTPLRKTKITVPITAWDAYDPKKIFQVYIVASIIINASQFAIWAFPSLVQYFFFFFYIKWGFFLITFISIFKRQPDLKIFLFMVIGFEFVLGLSSYFASNFINIVIFSLIGYVSIAKKITIFRGTIFAIIGALLFHMSVLWTASKTTYRNYLNKGQAIQTVKVSKDEARAKLLELITHVDERTYRAAIEDVVNRIGYIQYFAAAVRFVPDRIPYEDGKIYWSAVEHFLVPRFINPDKPILDDSKHTNKYTGLGLSGKERGTSFSLGSFADAYIDFGPIFMVIPIFLFGTLFGYFFRTLYKTTIWGIILTGPFFLLVNVYGADTIKALGFILIYFVVMIAARRYLIEYIDPWMRKSTEQI